MPDLEKRCDVLDTWSRWAGGAAIDANHLGAAVDTLRNATGLHANHYRAATPRPEYGHSARRSLAVNPARKPSRWSGFSFAITSSRHSRRTGHTAHSPRVNCVFARPLPRTGYHHSSGVPRHSASSIHEVMNERSHPGYADGIPAQESDTSP
jgi:hypothetical protein